MGYGPVFGTLSTLQYRRSTGCLAIQRWESIEFADCEALLIYARHRLLLISASCDVTSIVG